MSQAARCLVVGLGSIGTRHAQVLGEAGYAVATLSRRDAGGGDIAAAVAAHRPEYVVIATETAHHATALAQLAATGFGGAVMVEKPLFAETGSMPKHRFGAFAVAYPLRCHPGLQQLKAWLAGERILSAQLYVGQYLPEWRPGRDYRATYSAKAAEGGGALRDLSHELDYADWLFGPWQRVAALGGHWSDLAIDSDDCCTLLAAFARCPAATIQLNYLDRQHRRELVINTAAHSFSLDLVAGTLRRDREPALEFALPRNELCLRLHRDFLAGAPHLCDAASGQRVVAMIDAAEHAARSGYWIAAGERVRAA